MFYALETFNISGTSLQFWDFYKTLSQARKDAKQCLKDGCHTVTILKEISTNGCKWVEVERLL